MCRRRWPAAQNATTNYALQFDGQTGHAVVEDFPLDHSRPFTMECFVRPAVAESNGGLLQFDAQAGDVIALGVSAGRPRVDWSSGVQSGQKLPSAMANHVALVFTGDTLHCYVNGTRFLSKAKESPQTPSTGLLIIAADRKGATFVSKFAGQFDEIHISQVARYTTEFTPLKPNERFLPDADTLALYHCDESAGNVLTDSSPNKHHGKISGAKWVKVDGSPISVGSLSMPQPPTSSPATSLRWPLARRNRKILPGCKACRRR